MERSRSPDEDLPRRQRGRGRKIGAAPEYGGGVTRLLTGAVLIEQVTHFLGGCSNECWGDLLSHLPIGFHIHSLALFSWSLFGDLLWVALR